MKTDIIIQARVGSTRLPEKILKKLPYNRDYTLLDQVIRRVSRSKEIDDIIIATTKEPGSEKIVNIAKKNNVQYFKGSELDVLERYYQTANSFGSEVIVRVTSDSPCIDWNIIDEMINAFNNNPDIDYISNTLTRTYPHGLDAEVFSFDALEKSYNVTTRDYEREHVTPYIYQSDKFNIKSMEAPSKLSHPDIRITVDTIEDYTLVCNVYDYLYEDNNFFDAYDIVDLFNRKPWLKNINRRIIQKKVKFDTLSEEVEEAIKVLELQDLNQAAELLGSIKID